MRRTTIDKGYLGPSPPRRIVRASLGAPFRWIERGMRDLLLVPSVSLVYGILFTGVSFLALKLIESGLRSTLGYLSFLIFIAPFLAAGLYAASRDIEAERKPRLGSGIRTLWQRKAYLTLYSLMLAALILGCIRLSAALIAVYVDHFQPGTSTEAMLEWFSSPFGMLALVVVATVASVTIAVIFAVNAVALPLVLDGEADFINAMTTSFLATVHNPMVMLLWGVSIAILIGIAISVWIPGLALVFPVLSHATWHCYRELLK